MILIHILYPIQPRIQSPILYILNPNSHQLHCHSNQSRVYIHPPSPEIPAKSSIQYIKFHCPSFATSFQRQSIRRFNRVNKIQTPYYIPLSTPLSRKIQITKKKKKKKESLHGIISFNQISPPSPATHFRHASS